MNLCNNVIPFGKRDPKEQRRRRREIKNEMDHYKIRIKKRKPIKDPISLSKYNELEFEALSRYTKRCEDFSSLESANDPIRVRSMSIDTQNEEENDYCTIDLIIQIIRVILIRQKNENNLNQEVIELIFQFLQNIPYKEDQVLILRFLLIALVGNEETKSVYDYCTSLLSEEIEDDSKLQLIEAMFIYDAPTTFQNTSIEIRNQLRENPDYPYYAASALSYVHFLEGEELSQVILAIILCLETQSINILTTQSDNEENDVNNINLEFDILTNSYIFAKFNELISNIQQNYPELFHSINEKTAFLVDTYPRILQILGL